MSAAIVSVEDRAVKIVGSGASAAERGVRYPISHDLSLLFSLPANPTDYSLGVVHMGKLPLNTQARLRYAVNSTLSTPFLRAG